MTEIPKPALKVLLCSPRGFCAGVVRAIDTVERALARYGAPVYVRHEIVHNRYVVESLKAKGAIFVEELDESPEIDSRGSAKAQSVRARRHLSVGHQSAPRGRDPLQARP
jgi:4-hydroxy-3-methylbut-2-enyl diphosphate reductase IspH